MTDTIRSLDRIATQYTFFERDQVLTPAHLNGLAEYLDDQGRLTRVALIGVGIACGLWARLDDERVVLSHGVGTTTDGDAVFVPAETVYDRYKPYDRTAPVYPPFGGAGGSNMIRIYELVAAGVEDARALKLSGFADREEPFDLESMYAVLYVESYLRDPDLCTGTDCDNLGQESCHTLRLLLVEPGQVWRLLERAIATPDAAARELAPVSAARAMPGGALNSEAALAGIYRTACLTTLADLLRQLDDFYDACKPFLEEVTRDDPGPRWRKRLEGLAAEAERIDRGVQYYYDFLKDLVEAWNAFLEAMAGDTAVCAPDLNAFPKHLVLGPLDPAQRSARKRTGFYPSPMVSADYERRARALFLLRRLDALIAGYRFPAPARGVRITPSRSEMCPLDERAIPFYYDAPSVYATWSYDLSRRGLERRTYSYNADLYGAEGPAAAPLEAQLGAYDFFRIEGHLGLNYDIVKRDLGKLIGEFNLPIDVEYVFLDKPRKGWRPPRRFADLYRFHHLMRADLTLQLDDVNAFGERFVSRVTAAAEGDEITNEDNNNVPIVGTAKAKKERLAVHAGNAKQKVAGEVYDPRWRDDVTQVSSVAVELHEAFSPVTKKEFVTPLDHVIAGQPARWLGWLDDMIDTAQEQEAASAQFSQFLRDHPGLEHHAGAPRGGTFVLVCDAQNSVVGDFMLPYTCCEERREQPRPPVLVPPVKPPFVLDKPIRLVPFPDKARLTKFKDDLVKGMAKEVALHTKYLDGLIAGTKTGGTILPGTGGTVLPGSNVLPTTQPAFSDPVLTMRATETLVLTNEVDRVRTNLLDTALDDATRTRFETDLAAAQDNLAKAIVTTTEYLAAKNMDVKTGTEGAQVMALASGSLSRVTNTTTLAGLEKSLTTLAKAPGTQPQMAGTINNLLMTRGAW
jgi:hypothetical protein